MRTLILLPDGRFPRSLLSYQRECVNVKWL